MDSVLNVCEIFRSIQGEGTRVGLPCILIRLSGCNLHCSWCDTKYAWNDGQEMTVEDVLQRIKELGWRRVEITGGEPLLQPGSLDLLKRLCDAGYETLLETNGSMSLEQVDPRAVKIVDFKCPSSGHSSENLWENVQYLRATDEVKLVIADRQDYDFAKTALIEHHLTDRCTVIFAPVTGQLDLGTLAEWILADRLDVRLGAQFHKIIWPGKDRGV